MLDLVIRGGAVATAGSLSVCDVGVLDGRIVQLGGGMQGRRMIDAGGRYVFPGGIDVHVHFTPQVEPRPDDEQWADDFYDGSRAAIAGGITTVGNMTYPYDGETLADALRRDLAVAARDAAVDYILHPVLKSPSGEAVAELPGLAADGHTSLKIFMSTELFDARADVYLDAMRTAGQHGMLTVLHCEDGALIRYLYRQVLAGGRRPVADVRRARPTYTETAAVDRAVAFARAAAAPIYVAHLSSAGALDRCRHARAEGVPVYVETRPMYLYLTEDVFDEPDGAKYLGHPPARTQSDVEALWHGLAHGDVHCLGSDHAPWLLRQKLAATLTLQPSASRSGVGELEAQLPLLYSEGVRLGRISLSRFVELTSTNAAKLFGMYPRKGTIAVGSDADLVVWDSETRWIIDGAAMQSKTDYSVYDGWEVRGKPVLTVSRGEIVFEDGEVTAQRGRGRWVRRDRTAPL